MVELKEKAMQMTESKKPQGKSLVAKKDWLVVQNDFSRQFKKGEQIGDVPKHIIVALTTEGVI